MIKITVYDRIAILDMSVSDELRGREPRIPDEIFNKAFHGRKLSHCFELNDKDRAFLQKSTNENG